MPQQIGWSVESKLLYEIKQLTRQLSGRQYILTFPNFASFPTPGITGTLYVDESTGDIYVWNGTAYTLLSAGITALNGLIAAAQLLVTGSTGTDFNISSVGTTHTFNIPTASATNRGLLSSANWTTFNNKQNAITLTTTGTSGAATLVGSTLNIPQYQSVLTNPVTGTGTTNYVPKFTAASTIGNSIIQDNGTDVGIGSNSAGARLEILRTATGAANNNTTGSVFGSLHGTGGGPSAYGFAIRHNGSAYAGISGSNFVAQIVSSTTNSNALEMYTTGATPLVFGTNATERLRITSGGDVGIGTASPNGKLDVANAGDVAIWATATSAGSAALYLYPSGGGVAQIASVGAVPLQMLTNGAERMRIFANGRVFVGASPTDAGYQFDVNGTGRFQQLTSSTSFLDFAHYFYNGGGTNDIYFSTRGNGAGNGNASLLNTVSGARLSFHANSGPIRFGNTSQTAATANYLSIESNGNVLVNTLTDGGYKLDINGTLRSVNGANFATTSGNVGINTTAPVLPLQVSFFGGLDGNGNQLIIRNNNYYNTTNARTEPIINGYQTQIEMENLDGKIRFSTSSASNIAGSAASLLERMRITNNGEVWINTTTDAGDYKLQVSGNIYNTGSAVLAATSGNVGIGTASPAVKLDVAASGGDIAAFRRTDAGNALVQYTNANTTDDIIHRFRLNAGAGNFYDMRYYGTGGYFGLQYNGNNGLHLTTSSEVLINTTSDAGDYKLQVAGNQYLSGKLVVGTTTDNGKNVQVQGDVKVTGGAFIVNDTGTGDGLTIRHDGSNNMSINQNNNALLNISTGGPSGDIVFNPASVGRFRVIASGGVRIIPQATVPTAQAGALYYDSATNKLKLYDGTSWVDLN